MLGAIKIEIRNRFQTQSNACTGRYNTANEMSCATFKATTQNPPMAPFAKGGGPKDRGIFSSNRYFHKRGKAREVRNDKIGKNFARMAAWRDKVF